MGGEGPYLRFNEDFRQGGASTTPPSPLDDKQLDEAYIRAHVFLLERVRQLVKFGWEQHKTDGTACGVSFHRPGGADDVIRRFLACVLELHTRHEGRKREPRRATSAAHCQCLVRTSSRPAMEDNVRKIGSSQGAEARGERFCSGSLCCIPLRRR